MKRIELSKKEVRILLKSIKNAEDRKAIKLYLQELQDIKSGKKPRNEAYRKEKANQLFDALVRVGLKIGETVVIEELVRHLLD